MIQFIFNFVLYKIFPQKIKLHTRWNLSRAKSKYKIVFRVYFLRVDKAIVSTVET